MSMEVFANLSDIFNLCPVSSSPASQVTHSCSRLGVCSKSSSVGLRNTALAAAHVSDGLQQCPGAEVASSVLHWLSANVSSLSRTLQTHRLHV